MILPVTFYSEKDERINWAKLIKKCYSSVSERPLVLGNHGYLLLPKDYLTLDTIQFVTPHQTGELKMAELDFLDHHFLADCNLYIAKVPQKNWQVPISNMYFISCLEICREALISTDKILLYTSGHLASREADGIKLIQHEIIRLSIAAVITQLEAAKTLLNTAKDHYALAVVVHFLMKAVHQLAELGGGRAMLRGNAIEVLFHLTLFQTLMLLTTSNDILPTDLSKVSNSRK